jgi:hypothetical protein
MTATKKFTIICYGITFAVFLAILLWGFFGSITGNELGFSLLNFYLLMPVTSFVMALILGIIVPPIKPCASRRSFQRMKWLYPVIFGACGFAIPSVIFGSTDLICLFFSFVPALIGLGIGQLVSRLRSKNKRDSG